jgi:hypothetical protein
MHIRLTDGPIFIEGGAGQSSLSLGQSWSRSTGLSVSVYNPTRVTGAGRAHLHACKSFQYDTPVEYTMLPGTKTTFPVFSVFSLMSQPDNMCLYYVYARALAVEGSAPGGNILQPRLSRLIVGPPHSDFLSLGRTLYTYGSVVQIQQIRFKILIENRFSFLLPLEDYFADKNLLDG